MEGIRPDQPAGIETWRPENTDEEYILPASAMGTVNKFEDAEVRSALFEYAKRYCQQFDSEITPELANQRDQALDKLEELEKTNSDIHQAVLDIERAGLDYQDYLGQAA